MRVASNSESYHQYVLWTLVQGKQAMKHTRTHCIDIINPPYHYHPTNQFLHFVTVATPVSPVTVCLPPLQTGPTPNLASPTVAVSKAQPWQSVCWILVFGGTVTVQPKGAVEVMVLVQVGEGEQVVRVVVPGRVTGSVGQSCGFC